MSNDNDTPFDKLDLNSLWSLREWVKEAVEAKGAKVTGAGVGMGGPFGVADLDIEIDGWRFNLEIRPRAKS